MNSEIEVIDQLTGKIETVINMTGKIDIPITQYWETDNEFGGKTAHIK